MLDEKVLIDVLGAIFIGGIGFAIMLFGVWLVKQVLEYLGVKTICFL